MSPTEHKNKTDKIIRYLFLFLIIGILIHYFFGSYKSVNLQSTDISKFFYRV